MVFVVFGEDPWCGFVDVFVGAADQRENAAEGAREVELVELERHMCRQGDGHLHEVFVDNLFLLRRWHDAAAIFVDHRHGAADEIAVVVGEVVVVAGDEELFGVVAVLTDRNLAQEIVAHSVDAVFVDELERIDDVALGFAHLAAVRKHPAVAENLLWQRNAGSEQDRWPDHRVEARDVFADNVHVRWPEFLVETVVVRAPAEGGDIVGEGVEPDVDDVLFVDRHRNAPVEGGAGDAEIFEPALDEVHHFIAAAFRHDEVWMLVDVFQELILVVAHLEEIAFFREYLCFLAAVRAVVTVDQLQIGEKGFAACAVVAAVGRFVDVAFFVDDLEELLHRFDVVVVGSADEFVVVDEERLPEVFKSARPFDDLVDVLFWRHASSFGGALDLHAVLVAAGEKEGVDAAHFFVARSSVGEHRAVGVADVQLGAWIIDRCGNIEGIVAHSFASSDE